MKRLQLPNLPDDAVNRCFDQVEEAVADLQRMALADAVRRIDESLSAGANTVSHGLGRTPQGCIVTSRSALYDVQFDRRATTTNDRTAVLNAAGAVVCDLVWF
jgi:hypothetical protein